MTSAPPPKLGQLIPIIVGDACCGFIFRRRDKFESFDIDLMSGGVHADMKSAIAALFAEAPLAETAE